MEYEFSESFVQGHNSVLLSIIDLPMMQLVNRHTQDQ